MGNAWHKKTDGGMARVRNVRHKSGEFIRDHGIYAVNKTSSNFQEWDNFPDSPESTEDYYYQAIIVTSGPDYFLVCATTPFYHHPTEYGLTTLYTWAQYQLSDGAWGNKNTYSPSAWHIGYASINEANNDIYTDSSLAEVLFAKTIEPSVAGSLVFRRVRI